MRYTDLSEEAAIILAIEFVARDVAVPTELAEKIGPEVMSDIQYPKEINVYPKGPYYPSY